MASPKPVEIAVVTRTYQGLEGNRVYAGTRFAVGKASGDLKVISLARFNQLRENRLARPLGEEDAAAIPARARYAGGPTKTVVQEAGGNPLKPLTASDIRKNSRNRVTQKENPPPPKAIVAPTGSQTGAGKSGSSLELGQASPKSTSGSRGRRTSASSPSTMPTR